MQSIKNKIVKEKLGIESEICKLGEGGGGREGWSNSVFVKDW